MTWGAPTGRAAHVVEEGNRVRGGGMVVVGRAGLEVQIMRTGVSCFTSFSLSFWPVQRSLSPFYQGGEEGKTWDRKGMLSTGLMAMLSGPAIFMGIGVVIATGWAIFMGAVAGMLTEAMLTGPVMVTGCWRLTGDVMLTVLVLMFICAAMVTALLLLELPRFIAVVMGAETVTGVAEAELQTSLPSGKTQDRVFNVCSAATLNSSLVGDKRIAKWATPSFFPTAV